MNDRPTAQHTPGKGGEVPASSVQGHGMETTLPKFEAFHHLVDAVQDYGIVMLDRAGRVATWNPGAERILGYTAAEILGQPIAVFYREEDRALGYPEEEVRKAARDGRYAEEGWRVRKDGTEFYANIVVTAIRSEGGELEGFAKVVRDLTDVQQREEALRESEGRFRALAENASEAIVTINVQDQILFANPAATRIFGYDKEELLQKHFSDLMPEALRSRHREGLLRYALSRKRRIPWDGIELPGLTKSGEEVPLEITFSQYEARGEMYFTGVMRDIRARKKSEEAIRRAKDEAEAANSAKSDFLAAMSHELRTPLNAIGGYIELIEMGVHGPVTESQCEALERVKINQRHLLGLINDVLAFAKLEVGKVPLYIKPTPAGPLMESLSPMVSPLAEKKSLRLALSPCDRELLVETDEERARQILLNLLSNAIKFTPEGGEVRLRCKKVGTEVVFEVEDNGPGIPPERHEMIFEPFVQIERRHNNPQDGVGLGLAISRDLAEAMHGRIEVESAPGKGSTFRLMLPSPRPKETARPFESKRRA